MIEEQQQARNQEPFRTGKFSWNQGTSINILLQHEKERPRREKISDFFAWKFQFKWEISRRFFFQIRLLFFNFWNYAPLQSWIQCYKKTVWKNCFSLLHYAVGKWIYYDGLHFIVWDFRLLLILLRQWLITILIYFSSSGIIVNTSYCWKYSILEKK